MLFMNMMRSGCLSLRARRRAFTSYVKRNTDPINLSTEKYETMKKHKIHLVLDNIRSALNVGSIFRSADAAACVEILTCGYTPHPPHKKIDKTALGAQNYVTTRHFESTRDAIMQLKREGVTVLALETTSNAESHTKYKYPMDTGVALVFGNEVSGIDTSIIDLCDATLEIKCHGYKNSLNVANACGIVAFEVLRQWDV